MKKFFSKAKTSKEAGSSGSPTGSGGYYDIKEKSLTKIYKAAWTGDHKKVPSMQSDVNTPDAEKRTPMHLASYKGHEKMIDTLLTFGAKIDIPDREGRTPLYRAVQMNRSACAKLLLNANAKRDDEALVVAVDQGSVEMLELMLGKWQITSFKSVAGKSLIHMAVTNGNAEVLAQLLRRASSPDETDAEGRTALMVACREGQVELLRALLNAGANPMAKDAGGRSCSDYAGGNSACLKLLRDEMELRPPPASRQPRGRLGASAPRVQTSSDFEDDESKSADYAIPTRSESAKASLAAVPEAKTSPTGGASGGGGGGSFDDGDDDWSASASAEKEAGHVQKPRLNIKRELEAREAAAAARQRQHGGDVLDGGAKAVVGDYDNDDDDTIASDFPPTLTPRSGKATPRDRNSLIQRQESDWDNSDAYEELAVLDVAQKPTGTDTVISKYKDDDADSDWDDSVAVSVTAAPTRQPVPPAAALLKSKSGQAAAEAAAGDSDSDWDGSEAAASSTKPKESARDEPNSDWDTSTETQEIGAASPRKRPIPTPPRPPPPKLPAAQLQNQQPQADLARRHSRTEKDGLQPIEEEAGDTPKLIRPPDDEDEFDMQRREDADKVIAMLQAGQFDEGSSPVPTSKPRAATGEADSASLLSDSSLPPVPQEVARLQAELAAASEQLSASRATVAHSEAERSRLAEELEEANQRLRDAAEDTAEIRKRHETERQRCEGLSDQLRELAAQLEDRTAEARMLRTDLELAEQKKRSAEQSEAEARAAASRERHAREEAVVAASSTAAAGVDEATVARHLEEAEAERHRADVAERQVVELRAEAEILRGRMRAQETRWAEERDRAESQAEVDKATAQEALEKMALSLEASRVEAAEMRLRAEAERSEAGQLRARLTSLSESAGQGDRQLADLAGQLHQIREANIRLEEQLAGERARTSAGQDELSRSLTGVREANEESSRLRAELARCQADLRESRTEARRLKDTEAALAATEGRLAGVGQANSELRQQLQRLLEASNKGEEKESQLQQRLCDILNGYRDDFDKTRSSLERSQGCLATELSQARSDLRASEQRCEKAHAELLGLRHEQSGLMRKLSQAEADLTCAKEAKIELEKEKIGLHFEATSLRSEVGSLRTEIGALKGELVSLRVSASSSVAAVNGTAEPAEVAVTAGTTSSQKMTTWRADEYEERIRHQEVRNAKLEMSLDFEQKKVRGLMKELDSVNELSVDELRRACLDLSSERDRWSSDCQHYRQLYDQEKRLRLKLAEELERMNNSEAQATAALSLERERNRLYSTSQSVLGASGGHVMQPQQQQYNVYSSHQSLVSPLQPDPLLQQRLRSELDRSISKHLESDDYGRFSTSKTRSNGNLNKTTAESDQSYLTYLKKKYLV